MLIVRNYIRIQKGEKKLFCLVSHQQMADHKAKKNQRLFECSTSTII